MMQSYELPEYDTLQEFLQEVEIHPEYLNEIVGQATIWADDFSTKPFVDRFHFNINAEVVPYEIKPCTVLARAFQRANMEEIRYLLGQGAKIPEDVLDHILDGKGQYYTWRDFPLHVENHVKKAEEMILLIQTFTGNPNYFKEHTHVCSRWWLDDFMVYAEEEGGHPYLNSPILSVFFPTYLNNQTAD
jgi:hypothetical protein